MQIGSALTAQHLHLLQAKRSTFKCHMSPFNTITDLPSSSSSSSSSSSFAFSSSSITKQHLANLEKLLQKQNSPTQIDSQVAIHKDPNKPAESLVQPALKVKAPIEALNLATILWPQANTTTVDGAGDMSPKHLNRLQRLLSMTPEYSPRNHLGTRWEEYHGSHDWNGLLNPFDENLRREVVRYGEFVQAAYHGFYSNPTISSEEPPLPRHVVLPDRSYRVTKSLYATSSVGLPNWVDDIAPDLGWMTQRSSWIGYVAVCDDKREITRMGRRDIIIALRGTGTCLEWAENVRAQLTSISGQTNPDREQPKVECGFLSLYKTKGAQVQSLAESVVEEVNRLIELYKGEALSITVTGHSLGAALSLLVADELSNCTPNTPPIAVFSFGGPRVGNKAFANLINDKGVKVLRIVNSQDVVTRVPVAFMDECSSNKTNNNNNNNNTNKITKMFELMLERNMGYSHVGTELRLDIKTSPFLKPNADVACCHDLEAYLHLVDGFLASNCPFRPNAKRSLVRLLQDQKSNVKKLYTSKVKDLSLNPVKREGGLSLSGCLPSPS